MEQEDVYHARSNTEQQAGKDTFSYRRILHSSHVVPPGENLHDKKLQEPREDTGSHVPGNFLPLSQESSGFGIPAERSLYEYPGVLLGRLDHQFPPAHGHRVLQQICRTPCLAFVGSKKMMAGTGSRTTPTLMGGHALWG